METTTQKNKKMKQVIDDSMISQKDSLLNWKRQFIDNRAPAIQQRKLQIMIQNSPRLRQMRPAPKGFTPGDNGIDIFKSGLEHLAFGSRGTPWPGGPI